MKRECTWRGVRECVLEESVGFDATVRARGAYCARGIPEQTTEGGSAGATKKRRGGRICREEGFLLIDPDRSEVVWLAQVLSGVGEV